MLRYGGAVVSVGLSWTITRLLSAPLGNHRSLLFFTAVVVSALYGGFGPGLVATFGATAALCFISSSGHVEVSQFTALRTVMFLAIAVMVSWMSAARRRAELDLRNTREDLEVRVQERTSALSTAVRKLEHEIDERNRTEQSLRQSEARKVAILEASLDCIISLDEFGRMTEFNRAAQQTFGYSREQAVGKLLSELVMSPVPPTGEQQPAALFPGAGLLGKRVEMEGRRSDGAAFPVEVALVPTGSEGSVAFSCCLRDITDQRAAEKDRSVYQGRLRDLAAQLLSTEEAERRRLAVMLHDGIGQILAVAQIKLDSMPAQDGDFAAALADVRELVSQAISQTRSLTTDLSPPILYEAGLTAAVEWLAAQTRRRHDLAVDVRTDEGCGTVDEQTRALAFAAVRELIMNVVKHAHASRARISLSRREDLLRIGVADNGIGLGPSKLNVRNMGPGGFGLFNIRERIGQLGGTFRLESEPGKGTLALLEVPVSCSGDVRNLQQDGGSGSAHPSRELAEPGIVPVACQEALPNGVAYL